MGTQATGSGVGSQLQSEARIAMTGSAKVKMLLREKPAVRNVALVLCILSIPLSLDLVWYAWFRMTPSLWRWGFSPLSWRAIPSGIGSFFLVAVAAWFPLWAVQLLFYVLGLYVEAEATKTTKSLDRGSNELATVEEDLRQGDSSGLVLLLRYSRVQLEAYYRIGLTQTQRSFRYSIIAMWIGFTVILIGIVVRIVDLKSFGLLPPDNNVTTLVILSGVVIEMVSALFLWVYRRSVRQLTYFYDRQMYNHTVMMCHRLAETMHESDEVKKNIVEKVLDKAWVLEQEALPQGTSLLTMGVKSAPIQPAG